MATTATISSPTFGPPVPGVNEKGRLDATLRRLGDLYPALQAGQADVAPQTLLSELRVDLELHFALEEANAYFGVVLRERPSLSHGISKLRHEHATLLEKVERMRALAPDRARWSELATLTSELVDAFRAHEREEADLLQEFFLRDDGVGAD
ncbi:MAG TPA: hemerythrin domain-containing protein [Polyangiaceae bacterium]|jgi:hemerythrin|nr:hemerythrin domain-containing protein [Polyangiaceae bacterium]